MPIFNPVDGRAGGVYDYKMVVLSRDSTTYDYRMVVRSTTYF